jgi:hypothetical protein
MTRSPISNAKFVGPWPCNKCGKLEQCAWQSDDANRIFCRNDLCGYRRTVMKNTDGTRTIIENDGSVWQSDTQLVEGEPVKTTKRIRGDHPW